MIGKYVKEDEVPRKILADIVKRSCGAFRSGEVTPLVKVDGHYVLVSHIYSVCSFVKLGVFTQHIFAKILSSNDLY